MKTNVIVNLQVEGIHQWTDIRERYKDYPELANVHFLEHPHRHMFHIEAKKRVSHDDRDIEIILLKRGIQEYISINYGTAMLKGEVHNFNDMSCEMIAADLVEAFGLNYCKVLEDGENGAEVVVW